jgi:ribosomal protein S18 acetylase RimI-like enzyme
VRTAEPPAVRIRTFRKSEWQAYRDARLCALQDSPDAFSTTFEEARRWPENEWEARFRSVRLDTDLPLCAEVDGVVAGMAWARIDPAAPQTAHVYQMWVEPAHRGRGIGRALLEAAIAWAPTRGARRVTLGVTCGNTAASRLYAAAGFMPIGEPEPLRPGSPLRVQTMTLMLAPEDTR